MLWVTRPSGGPARGVGFASAVGRWQTTETIHEQAARYAAIAALMARRQGDRVGELTARAIQAVALVGMGRTREAHHALRAAGRITASAPADDMSASPFALTGDGRIAARGLGLSAREIDVLELLAQGWSDRIISATLFISVKTTGHHVSHILTKLGVDRRGEAAAIAFRLGHRRADDP